MRTPTLLDRLRQFELDSKAGPIGPTLEDRVDQLYTMAMHEPISEDTLEREEIARIALRVSKKFWPEGMLANVFVVIYSLNKRV